MSRNTSKDKTDVRSVYERLIGVMLDFNDLKELQDTVHPDFTGYGSAAHEFFRTRADLEKMARMQKDQLEGQEFRYDRKPVAQKFFADGASCLILEEFDLFFSGNEHHLLLRLSTLVEWIDGTWLVTHVHGSTPDSDIAEEEAFPEQGLLKKNEELEAKIRERTRELEIEAALERTRAQSMQMQHSSELNTVSNVFHEQLLLLGIDSEFSFVWLPSESREDHLFWTTWTETANGEAVFHSKSVRYPLDLTDPYNATCIADWESGLSVHEHFVPPADIVNFFASWEELLEGASHLKAEFFAEGIYYTEAFMKYGCFGIDIKRPLTDEEKSILHRFAIEFERTYSRFLDLQKAEIQAREAQVEASLERLRSASMAMQKTEDISEVTIVFLDQLKELNLNFIQAWINVFHLEEGYFDIWFSPLEGVYNEPAHLELPSVLFEDTTFKSWEAGHAFSHLSLHSKEEVDALVQACDKATDTTYFSHFQEKLQLERLEFLDANYKYGTISISGHEKATREEKETLLRFAKVFEQTYTRFLDLQKAEAQAREAQTEAALERVRSRSMGMQKSEDLKEVVKEIFDQFAILSVNAEHAGIVVDYEPEKDWHFWVADTQDIPAKVTVPYLDLVWDRQFTEAKKEGRDFFTTQLDFDEKNNFYKQLLPHIEGLTTKARDFYMSCPGLAASTVIQKDIGLYIENFSGIPYTDEENSILKRFGKVFQQTYTRFLDLQKAEAQTRESRIEAALERVRSRTMAMHHSGELSDVLSTLFEQFDILGIHPSHAVLTLIDKEKNTLNFRSTGTNGHRVEAEQEVDLKVADAWVDTTEKWKKSSPNSVNVNEYPPEVLPEVWEVYSDILAAMPEKSRPRIEDFPDGLFITEGYCRFGYIGFAHNRAPTDEEKDIVRRFATEFGTLYQRFLDLEKAEAQARESQIEAALERVRSRTMAMQHSDELAEASHLLDKEVRELGIKTWGCAFNIYREHDSLEWFGNEAGLLPTYTVPREGIFKDYFDAGQKGESLLVKEIAGEQCTAHYEFMSTLPVVGDVLKQLKKTNGSFPSYQIDHVAYFKYGYLLFITREAVLEAHDIFKRFAKVFEQTYTRFLDLQLKEEQAVKLVKEKQRLEKTLTDLQATQQQLIHAEKMASLGELTAGIAHEIQNPLNFVNNFSEVSRELLEELIQELKNGDTEEVDAIARDVEQNLTKILHHGKRADSIVKGMLQHSRSGKVEKEATNLNALADEYLRLAYHGLRAKDKAFNANMETDLDPGLPKVNVVPQDIGRVLLNLFTNAFHAVNEKKGSAPKDYQPTIWVESRKTAQGVEISVRDNGGGIPTTLREKIFQPFFTTKPTGEGTGLGLSMSYDIVTKGHGGDLIVDSTQGKGTTFTVSLPFNS